MADPADTPRVVIADHHDPSRQGVRLALERDGFIVTAETATAPDAVASALRDEPDVCLLDIDMPGGGIAAAARIHTTLPDTPVVMFGETATDEDLFNALEVGAAGFLLKEMNPDRLGPTLRDAIDGNAALPRALTSRLIGEFRARSHRPRLTRPGENELTNREWDVLDCLRGGLSTRRIARTLFISETTVRRHIGSIRAKLGVDSREEAVKVLSQRSTNLNAE